MALKRFKKCPFCKNKIKKITAKTYYEKFKENFFYECEKCNIFVIPPYHWEDAEFYWQKK